MKRRYILAPQAARDLVGIWKYLARKSGEETADRVESVIRRKIIFLTEFSNAGHERPDLTRAEVRFFSIYSYLVVYRPDTKPLQVVAILHGNRDVPTILSKRL